ncbi:MAG: response regulator [Candidatus Riflebacteria bacterium HGW-Riflebacteria-1]|jgi:CheY-like chemotaxis protein|nr:MAG: response regulator [Candidatus Riflebacteria bacterium HGW-Riflebacteria-1]
MQQVKTVLLVDDDHDFRIQQRAMLEALKYNVVEAENAAAALGKLENPTPDIAIVDLMMEEHDTGFTLCHNLKKRLPNMPIIMVTGVAAETGVAFNVKTREEHRWIKADALLEKPVRAEQLQQEIKKLLKV